MYSVYKDLGKSMLHPRRRGEGGRDAGENILEI